MSVGTALWIAATNVRRLMRDRSAFFFTMFLPLALILVLGRATEAFDDPVATVGVHVQDTGAMGRELVRGMEATDLLQTRPYAALDELRRAVRRSTVAAGIVIPEGYTARLERGEAVEVAFIADTTRRYPAAVRAAVEAEVAQQGTLVKAVRFTEGRAGLTAVRQLAARSPGVEVDARIVGPGTEPVEFGTGVGYQAPANLILFIFITSVAAAGALIESRRLGITARMLASPVHPRTVVAGEALGRFAIASLQAVFILGAGSVIFGVDWGDGIAAAALVASFVLVATGAALVAGTVFRTAEQAGSVGPPLGIALGMLGGCMWPLEIVPETMQKFGHAFPHAWAMDAWIKLTAYGGDLGSIATELAVLSGFAVVLLAVAIRRMRRIATAATA